MTDVAPDAPATAGPRLIVDDAHDARLVAAVRPPEWVNPEPAPRYHLVVIGAGTGGLVSAAVAAGLGARVALVERALMGGDCLTTGCVPSKAVLRAARAWCAARDARDRFGAPTADHDADGDFAAAMARMRRLRADIAPADGAARFRALGVDVFFGDARFVDAGTVEVRGGAGAARLRFRRAIVATGGRPAVPAIPGLAGSGYHTNETIFSITERPRHLVVIGAGPVGCELAQAFACLGARVTLVARDTGVLPHEDADAAALIERALTRDGVRILRGATVTSVEGAHDDAVVHATVAGRDESLPCDAILVATGRLPNVEHVGLDAAGVAYGPRGITVDDRLRTSNRRVYAVGDAIEGFQLTHVADFQARAAVQNALFFGRKQVSALLTPRVVYTSPEVASVGLGEAAARARGVDVDVVTVPMREVDRAVLDDETEGFCRIVLAAGGDRILGATLVSEHAGESVGELVLAMTGGLGLAAIGRTMHPYPTQAEVLRRAADAWSRRRLTPRVRALFALFFRIFR